MTENDSGEFDQFEDTEQEDIDEESQESFEEDLENIELEESGVGQSGGVRGLTVALLILVLAVAAYAIYWHVQRQAKIEAAREAKNQRIQTYKTQLKTVTQDVEDAKAAMDQNDIEKGLKELESAKKKLTALGSQANESNDQQWANYIVKKRDQLLSADKTIAKKAEAYEDARKAMERAREDMKKAVNQLSNKFENVDLSGAGGGGASSQSPAEQTRGPAAPAEATP